jgi:hypothetical protein
VKKQLPAVPGRGQLAKYPSPPRHTGGEGVSMGRLTRCKLSHIVSTPVYLTCVSTFLNSRHSAFNS